VSHASPPNTPAFSLSLNASLAICTCLSQVLGSDAQANTAASLFLSLRYALAAYKPQAFTRINDIE